MIWSWTKSRSHLELNHNLLPSSSAVHCCTGMFQTDSCTGGPGWWPGSIHWTQMLKETGEKQNSSKCPFKGLHEFCKWFTTVIKYLPAWLTATHSQQTGWTQASGRHQCGFYHRGQCALRKGGREEGHAIKLKRQHVSLKSAAALLPAGNGDRSSATPSRAAPRNRGWCGSNRPASA